MAAFGTAHFARERRGWARSSRGEWSCSLKYNTREARKRQLARLGGAKPPAPRAAIALAKSQAYQDAADAPATLRAYATDLANYKAWCDRHGFVVMPATPEVVGAYLAAADAAIGWTQKDGTRAHRRAGKTVDDNMAHPDSSRRPICSCIASIGRPGRSKSR